MAEETIESLRAEIARLRSVIQRAGTILYESFNPKHKCAASRAAGEARKILRAEVPAAERDRKQEDGQ